jgi:hypothetical protein
MVQSLFNVVDLTVNRLGEKVTMPSGLFSANVWKTLAEKNSVAPAWSGPTFEGKQIGD